MQSKFRNALLNGGYQVSASHTEPEAIKTNAPSSVIWDILRCTYLDPPPRWVVVNVLTVGIGWAKTAPNPQAETTPAHAILSQEPQYVAVNSSYSVVSLTPAPSRSGSLPTGTRLLLVERTAPRRKSSTTRTQPLTGVPCLELPENDERLRALTRSKNPSVPSGHEPRHKTTIRRRLSWAPRPLAR